MATKATTGLVGLAVEAHPREKLKILYSNILKTLSLMPQEAAYRKYTERNCKEKLDLVNKMTDLNQLEETLNSGQLEEVIEQTKKELKLARRMHKWKPWEPLLTQPPKGQWDWP